MTPAPAVIFVGPSLAGAPVTLPPGVVLAPPAEAGDLYRAARGGGRIAAEGRACAGGFSSGQARQRDRPPGLPHSGPTFPA